MAKDLPEFDLDNYLPYRLTVAAARQSAGLAREYKSRYGISIPEWRVLVNLAYSDKISVRDLEKRVSLEKSKISRAASRLESAGYISKTADEDDRRLLQLKLTDKGTELLSELIPLAISYQARLEESLAEHLPALHAALDVLMAEPD